MRILIIIALTSLFLSSCTWPFAKKPAPSPYPSTPIGVSTELTIPKESLGKNSYTARGTEPGWSVSVKPGATVLSRPGEKWVVETTYTTLENESGNAVVIKSVKGDFFMNMKSWSCSDGMSETQYGYSATVLVGAETLTGCAMKVQ